MRVLVCLLVACCLTACGDDGPRLRLLDDDAVILAFGDSLTYGTGAGRAQAYPQVLAELSGLAVVNAGVPGEVTAAGLARITGVLDKVQPALLILCHGGNDFLRKKDLAAAQRNLASMIAEARARDIDVLLLGVPRPGLWLNTADLYLDLAASTSTAIEADALAEILGEAGLKSDPVHPNAAGYRRLAEAVHARLQAAGAL